MSTDEGGWRWQADVIHKMFPNNTVTSTFRNNSVAAGGKGGDYHSRGRAVDIGGPNLSAVFDGLVRAYPCSAEIIYSPKNGAQIKDGAPHLYGEPTRSGHFTHVHWAIVGPTTVGAPYSCGGPVGNAIPAGNVVTDTVDTASQIGSVISFLTDPGSWKRIGLGLAGVIALAFAIRSAG